MRTRRIGPSGPTATRVCGNEVPSGRVSVRHFARSLGLFQNWPKE